MNCNKTKCACISSVKTGTMYHLALRAWCPAQFLTCRRSPHQRTICLYGQMTLRSTLLRWASHVGLFHLRSLPSFQRKIHMLPLFPQFRFEEEVSLILSNVHFNFSALDLTESQSFCILLHKFLLLYLPHCASFSTLTFADSLQIDSVSPIKMKQTHLSQPFSDHPVCGSFSLHIYPWLHFLILNILSCIYQEYCFIFCWLIFLYLLECRLHGGWDPSSLFSAASCAERGTIYLNYWLDKLMHELMNEWIKLLSPLPKLCVLHFLSSFQSILISSLLIYWNYFFKVCQ